MSENTDSSTANTSATATGTINVAGAQPEITSDRSGEEVRLVLGEFAGPLDLLLYLIRQ
ncbi:MAG: hypothetical protein H7Y30_04940, partial [Pyrinomonadaceae bacterium]|nr:hypothetical protein [Pyrinomonadaceae bacterium]